MLFRSKQCHRAKVRKYAIVTPNKRVKKYGITAFDFDRFLAQQKGVCAICKKNESHKNKKNLSVDHDHTTGKVRGLLCHRCNTALGLFNDDIKLLIWFYCFIFY